MKANFSNKERYKQIMEKREKTSIQKYGYTAAAKRLETRKKLSSIMKAHFSNPKRKREILEKRYRTNLKRYGVSGAVTFRYIYKNVKFDSSWELAFYCYNLSLNKPIKRCTKSFEYEFEGNKHSYFPDFEIEDKIFEVKGDHFLNEEGLMICPFDRDKDGLFQAKQQCGIKNNVILITRKEITPYLDYMENKYGKNWKEIFKIKKAK